MYPFETILDMPWRVTDEVRRLFILPYIRCQFALCGITWRQHWRILGKPIIQRCRGSTISLGPGLVLRSWPSSNPLTPSHPVVLATRTAKACIEIGAECGFTGTTIVAAEHIAIGNRVLVGTNTTIVDTDFHPLTPEKRLQNILDGCHAPIVIQDDVFIGMQSLILKGVTIGQGSVIGAGSVVTHDVPPGVIAAGNPARVIREL